ncbi:ABC transporter permease [Nonomuraea antimicrobica]
MSGESALLLGLDAAKLGELFDLRPDLSAQTVAQMSLALAGRQAGRLDLPGQPRALTVRVDADAAATARLVLSDALGVWQELPLGDLREGANRIDLDLAALAGRSGEITYPLALRGLITGEPTGPGGAVRLTGLSADGRDVPVSQAVGAAPGVIAFAPSREPEPLPVVLTPGLATALKLGVGQSGPARLAGRVQRVEVVGIVTSMPTSAPGQQAVLADWGTMQAYELAAAQSPRPATEWWLAAADTVPAREILREHPQWDVTALDRRELTAKLRDDPLASGLQGALILGFAAALGFAVLGFLVNAVVAARERSAEFAVLRALGTSPRQMFGMLVTEQAFVIGLSPVAGTALAVVVGNLVVPRIVLTGQASAVTPGVLLHIPWTATAALLALVAGALFTIVAGLARHLRRGQSVEDR